MPVTGCDGPRIRLAGDCGALGAAAIPATLPPRLSSAHRNPQGNQRQPCHLPEGPAWRRTATPPSPTRPRWFLPAVGTSSGRMLGALRNQRFATPRTHAGSFGIGGTFR